VEVVHRRPVRFTLAVGVHISADPVALRLEDGQVQAVRPVYRSMWPRTAAMLRQDQLETEATFAYAWSSGHVEGQVTRTKLAKRQMFGRAKFGLLRRRVLLAS